jgi:hypothetical protein
MAGRGDGTALRSTATFELESFSWNGPDRLELTGRFDGLGDAPAGAPVLVVRGRDTAHRLPAVDDGRRGPPADGQRWSAVFAWQQAPIPFDDAELELGDELVVGLPSPGGRGLRFRHRVFEVRAAAAAPDSDGDGGPPREEVTPGSGVERLQLESALLTAQQEAHELRAALALAQEDLGRARADLAAERDGRSADAERFREALEHVRASASEAVAVEQAASEQLLQEARSAAAAELDGLRAEADGLRPAREEADTLRADLDRASSRESELRARLERARDSVDGARAEVAQLHVRLTSVVDGLGDGA